MGAEPAFPCGCSVCLVVFSIGGWVLFGFGASERSRLDPFFAPIPCTASDILSTPIAYEKPDDAWIQAMNGPGNISAEVMLAVNALTNVTLTMWKTRTCTNPNEIRLTTGTVEPGTIEWKEELPDGSFDMVHIGRSWVNESTMEMQGAATSWQYTDFTVPVPVSMRMAATAPSTLHYTSVLRTTVELSMVGVPITTMKESTLYCKQLVNYLTMETGRLDCGSNLAELRLIPFGEVAPNVTYIEANDQNEEGGQRRDLMCGLVMAIGSLIALVFMARLFCLVRQYLRLRKTRANEKGGEGASVVLPMSVQPPAEQLGLAQATESKELKGARQSLASE